MVRWSDNQPAVQMELAQLVPDEEWAVYRPVIERLRERGLPFALGGGLGVAMWSGHARNTKDLDLMVLPRDRAQLIELLTEAGFEDFFERSPYRRDWIYRGVKGDVIIDVIWGMANWRAQVDERLLDGAAAVSIDGLQLPITRPEDLIWIKFYVMHRDRCDWPDALNMMNVQAADLDWPHLIERVGADATLFAGLMCAFRWLCPGPARSVPGWVWDRLGLGGLPTEPADAGGQQRAEVIDSYHDWFGPRRPRQEPGVGRAWHAQKEE